MKLVPKSPNSGPSKAEPLLSVGGPDFKKPVSRSRTIRIDFRDGRTRQKVLWINL